MVGIFSRLSGYRTGHRRTQSAINTREGLPQTAEIVDAATSSAAAHGIEVSVEFKPVERPAEPLDNDQPVKCPLPEPSIINDGMMRTEWMSNVRRRADLPIIREGNPLESETTRAKPRVARSNRSILPSFSAPENNIINLLEE